MADNPYDFELDEDKEAASPVTEPKQDFNSYNQERIEESNDNNKADNMGEAPAPVPTGCTRFFHLEFYEQFFRVSQEDVLNRIKLSFVPINKTFVEGLNENPDFYGPFWLMTTIIFLLSSTGNLSRYFSNFDRNEYLFKLELVRLGVLVVYSFGFGVPTALFFIMKFLGCSRLSLPEMICTYGYSLSCFIPIFLLCIIPIEALQWILIAYGMINTTMFLIFNLKAYLEDIELPKMYVVFGLIAGAQIALFLIFKLVFFKLAFETR